MHATKWQVLDSRECRPRELMGTISQLLRGVVISLLACSLSGCGSSRGTTKLTYSPPTLPIPVSFAIDAEGNWTVAAGVATQVGTFSIEHQFITKSTDTYVVFRNHKKGTDQVFALGRRAYVEIYTVGEHRLLVHKEENRFIIDAETISGTITAKLHSEDSYICRLQLKDGIPDVLVTYDRKLVIDNTVYGKDHAHISLDSVKSIDLVNTLGHSYLNIKWKNGIQNDEAWVEFSDSDSTAIKFSMLQDSIKSVAPAITYSSHTSSYYVARSIAFIIFGIIGVVLFLFIAFMISITF